LPRAGRQIRGVGDRLLRSNASEVYPEQSRSLDRLILRIREIRPEYPEKDSNSEG
jgi:hypothetical protein